MHLNSIFTTLLGFTILASKASASGCPELNDTRRRTIQEEFVFLDTNVPGLFAGKTILRKDGATPAPVSQKGIARSSHHSFSYVTDFRGKPIAYGLNLYVQDPGKLLQQHTRLGTDPNFTEVQVGNYIYTNNKDLTLKTNKIPEGVKVIEAGVFIRSGDLASKFIVGKKFRLLMFPVNRTEGPFGIEIVRRYPAGEKATTELNLYHSDGGDDPLGQLASNPSNNPHGSQSSERNPSDIIDEFFDGGDRILGFRIYNLE
jgi:hypothetical protein